MKFSSLLFVFAWSVGLIWAACITPILAQETPPPNRIADRPVPEFPLGVYWGWEQNAAAAQVQGLEKWEFVRKTSALLAQSGVDTVWVVNIELPDLKQLLQITRPLGLKLLPCLAEIEPRNLVRFGFKPDDPQYVERALEFYRRDIPRIVEEIGGDREGILAWVIIDEPDGKMLELVEPVRGIFADADPTRPATVVATWNMISDVIGQTNLPAVAIDVYPFFGPNAPSGPHTAPASQNYYSSNVFRAAQEAERDGRVVWAMPQSYAEIHGPWQRREDGAAVAAPGSYISWRMPTPPEIRWQIWEGVRAGAKGIVFFPLFMGYQANAPVPAAPTDPIFAPVLVKEATLVGELALLDNRGNPTPQFQEMSKNFRALAPHTPLLRRLQPVRTGWLSAGTGAQVSVFIDPETQAEYAVVVNPDMQSAQTVEAFVSARPGVLQPQVHDVLQNSAVKAEALGWAGGNFRIALPLEAGAGVLLKLAP